jgi:FAD/FMN-containing dehydrogenase
VQVLEAEVAGLDAALARGLAAARLVTARAAAVIAPAPEAGETCRLVVELAGEAPAVSRDAERWSEAAGAREASAAALDRVRELQGAGPPGAGLRVRVSALPSRLLDAARRLRAGGAPLVVYPGLGLLHAGFAAADIAAIERALGAAAAAARAGSGSHRIEAAPAFAKRGRDVFGEAGGALGLVRELKARFDPQGILNPGRFWGRP